jgi:hypothetical protein
VAVLFNAGDQLPVILLLLDVVGKGVNGVPAHIGPTALNVGLIFGLTVTVYVVVVAHWPLSGVNVYVLLAVLLTTAGLQVPVIGILLDELTGNVTTLAPSQMVVLLPKGKMGSIFGFTITLNVVPVTHPADVAVNT